MVRHSNTARTLLGFVRAVLSRWFPSLSRNERLDDIYNYLGIEGVYATSGQPSESQFQLIRDAGYEVVINLAPTSVLENSVVEERSILHKLGLNYVHIPVDFRNPTEDDFQSFLSNLNGAEKVWVHCAANMRVSAFTYRYRTKVLGQDEKEAMTDLQKIWDPIGIWSEFIQR